MKNSILISLVGFVASHAWAADQFTGAAHSSGAPLSSCDSFQAPSASDAEADANEQASAFCGAAKLKSVQTTDFSYSFNNCVWGGPQYHTPSDFVYATAEYRCEPGPFLEP